MSDDNVIAFPKEWNPSTDYVVDFEVDFEANPNQVSPMTEEEKFLSHLYNFAQVGLAIARNKNGDYAGNGDPFANFRKAEIAGATIPQGIVVRMSDKLARLGNLIQRPAKVSDESIKDTCIDLSNYCLILAAWYEMNEQVR